MFKLDGVTRKFGLLTAVDGVTLDIPDGQMVGVIGRSGAGKSTLLRMLNRLVDPNGGRILFRDTEVSALSGSALRSWRRDCAMVFQQFNLVPRLDVVSNVLHGTLNARSTLSTVFNLFPKADILRAIDILERLGVAEHAMKRAEALSGGQQQRVAIARALMQSPKVLLADEPIASLDPLNAKIVMDALKDINEREGITVITNLHTLDTARTYCERIIGMSQGRVVFDGTANELTAEAVREIYGTDGEGNEISEAITSTSITARPMPAAVVSPSPAMLRTASASA
ncbi:phosphonate ABC transporter ATP-binding protein [Stappia indica]|uniref:Phosphonate transport system ATP-binding protein n=1 Tax=Stappia indica TaxID=538381 RepID=A0A285SER7_9HYPH|nr:phosphonate ABC transporter ATP-binding protein [Stappia indica]SOC06161.1 phosphonate transport system ATP-binding protein [Stappia indica]